MLIEASCVSIEATHPSVGWNIVASRRSNGCYGLSKTRDAEDMCNYSEYLKQKAKEEAREEQKIKDKLEVLERMEARHYSDIQIMELLGIDIEKLMFLREMLQEKRTAVTAD